MNTKQQIVELSADMLRSSGFGGFSYLDISRKLSITKASVHHHYPKKQDLGLALCEWSHRWLKQGFEHFDEHGVSSWDKLERYLRAALKHSLSDQKMCPISAFYSDLAKLSPDMKDALMALDDYELDWVEKVMVQGIESGDFQQQEEPRALAALFIFSCKGALYYSRLHGKDLFHQTMKQFEYLIKT